MAEPWVWSVALGVLGAIFGSFIATVALRWPEGRSALRGRSQCDGCGRTLGPAELVPILSYLALRGRCRACGGRIAAAHPLIEAAGCGIGVAAGLAAPGWDGVAGAAFGWLLLALGALDLAAFWLPNLLTGALALAGAATGLAGLAPEMTERLIGGVAGLAALWAARTGYRALRGREGLGGGDPKLFGAIGLWLGWQALPTVLLAASLGGLTLALLLRAAGRTVTMTDRLPLGVFLAGAAWTVWIGGALAR